MTTDPYRKLRVFLDRLQSPFVGREEEARVVTLTLLSREHAVLVGEPGCVTGDTIVSDAEGRLYYFDELASSYGLGIHSFRFNAYPGGTSDELHIYKVNRLVEVVTERGFKLRATPNHPVMTDRGWVRADCLRPNDLVKVIRRIPSPRGGPYVLLHRNLTGKPVKTLKTPKIVNEELSELLGIYLIYGSVGSESLSFKVPSNHLSLLNDVRELMSNVFGEEVNDYAELRVLKGEGLIELEYRCAWLGNFFKLVVEDYISLKRVPKLILKLPLKELVSFFKGLFRGATYSGKGLKVRLKSIGLAEGIQVVLLRLGITALRVGSELIIDCYNDLVKLLKFKALPNEIRNRLGRDLHSGIPNHLIDKGFDRIVKVSFISGETVYDLHIPLTHCFLTNGLLSHNTAKSALVRRAAELLNAKFFKYLLTRFTEPAELFGPLDIKSLEEGRYVRLTQGKLPEADIAFLDEIFKANSAILNALNSLLQERVLYDGFTEMQVPLWSLFGASNEVPEDPEIEALYDRFCVRHFVRPVPEDYWMELLDKSWRIERAMYYEGRLNGGGVMSISDLRALHERVLNVNLEPIKGKLVKLFAIFESRGIRVTDRRKGKALKLIAANAVLEGRSRAEEHDLIVLKYVIPRDWDELDKVNLILSEELKTPYKYLKELEEIRNNVREVMNYVISLENVSSRYIESRFRLMLKDLEVTKERVMSMAKECSDERVRKVIKDILMLIDDAERAIERRIR